MKRIGLAAAITLAGIWPASADTALPASTNGYPFFVVSSCGGATFTAGSWRPPTIDVTGVQCMSGGGAGGGGAALSGVLTNPTSTLSLPSTTTAYASGNLIANSATAGSVAVPSFSIANAAGGAQIPRLRLATNDTTSTSWGGQTVRVDLWSAAPTFTNGDRGAYAPVTGTASHLGAYSCVFSAIYGDGAYAECAPYVNTASNIKLASGTAVYWTLTAQTGSGVTGASKTFTLTAEVQN